MTPTQKKSKTASFGRYGARAAGFGGKLAPVVQGVLGGLASQVGTRFVPGYGGALGLGGVGYFMNNPTLLTLAGINLSAMIPIGGILGGAGGNGGAI